MPFLLAEILNFQGSTHHIGVGSFSKILEINIFVLVEGFLKSFVQKGNCGNFGILGRY